MPTESLARKPAFWIVYALVACASALVAWRLFPLAIPIVNLEITMDRAGALERAEAIAAERALAPADARSAAQFAQDPSTQNYVELEGGGKDAFAKLVAGSVYSPYWWEVRLFRPGEVSEATVRFRPDGTPYGFAKHLAETFVPADPAGLALSVEAAQQIAETGARADWGVDFAPYRLLEKTQQTRTTGRVDHTFVYERSDERIAEARFRMRLVVSGNELTALRYFVHVPESFDRRYQELRSANNTIAGAASVAAGVLYGLGGCVFGVLWLARRHWLLWRPARNAGFAVGSLLGLMVLASAPAAWFSFDTAQSVETFWLREVGGALAMMFSRRPRAGPRLHGGGEPHAIRVSGSSAALARLVARAGADLVDAGPHARRLLFVPIELALIAGFYYVTNRWLGWWQPFGNPDRSQHPGQLRSRADADRAGAAGGLHGGMPVPRGPHLARGDRRRAVRPARLAIGIAVVAPGAGVRRRACELPGLPVVFAADRADRPGDAVGAHLPALRAGADDLCCTRCSISC